MEGLLTFIQENIEAIFVLALAILLGFELISNVPSVLHTPLMSGTNAISGVVAVGGVLLLRTVEPTNYPMLILGLLALILGMTNVVGGYAVTDRMLKMFKKKK